MSTRTEKDKFGTLELPEDSPIGIHTKRAINNFQLSERPVPLELVYAIAAVKKAAARANKEAGLMDDSIADAIIFACNEILSGKADEFFKTDSLQGGAGTSTNMNVNEVAANLALRHLGHQYGEYQFVHPLDHVNKGQSTNDVYPTALRIAAVRLVRTLSDACAALQESLQKKEQEFADVLKLGRTELMDALPVTLGEEFGAFAQAIARDRWRIYKVEERLRQINLGGTAVGTGINADRKYVFKVTDFLREETGIGLARAEYLMDITQNNDVFVEVSGLLKSLSVNLIKISSDLRLMNSGPVGGFAEIALEELQAGSSIMPGKVNPVIPEAVTQAALKVIANDSAITTAAAMGNLELNAFMPLIADCLIESLKLLMNGVTLLKTRCIDTVKANRENCRAHLDRSLVAATLLVPYIGYEQAESIVKESGNTPIHIYKLVVEKGLLDKETAKKILSPYFELNDF